MVDLIPERQMNRIVSHHIDVGEAIVNETTEAAGRASAKLAAHRHDGHAEIQTEFGHIDGYLILSDERGLKAALSIEFGRKDNPETGQGGMEGLFILHDAVGLEHD